MLCAEEEQKTQHVCVCRVMCSLCGYVCYVHVSVCRVYVCVYYAAEGLYGSVLACALQIPISVSAR